MRAEASRQPPEWPSQIQVIQGLGGASYVWLAAVVGGGAG